MRIEQRLSRALRSVDSFEPSSDLFARVERSVEEDRRHRRRLFGFVSSTLLAGAALAVWVTSMAFLNPTGTLVVPRWVLEVTETVIMVGVLCALGPSIRRFGVSYVQDIFRGDTHRSMLRLLDIAYYLTFTGWILDGVEIARPLAPIQLSRGLEGSATRLGMFFAAMGVLHVLTLYALPLVGLIFTNSKWRMAREQAELSGRPGPSDPEVARIDSMLRVGLKVVLILVVILVAANVIPLLIIGAGEISP